MAFSFFRSSALLFTLAVALRLLYSLLVHPDGLIWQDELAYDRLATQLARHGEYVSDPYEATPGWPALLAAVYVIFGQSIVAARVFQALLGGVLVLAIASTASIFFGRRVGLLAGLVTAFYPPLIYLSAVLYADHAATVLLASSLCALAWWRRDQLPHAAALAGLLLGATALTRPSYLPLIPVAAVYVAWESRRDRRWRHAGLVLLLAAATIAPWTFRNALVFDGHFIPVSTGFGLHLWKGNSELALGNADDRHLAPAGDVWRQRVEELPPAERARVDAEAQALQATLERLHPADADAHLRREAIRWIVADPPGFVRRSARRLVALYSPFSRTASNNEQRTGRNQMIAALSFLPILLLGLVGAGLALRQRPASWLLHATVLTGTAFYAVLTAATRFRLPLDPVWIIFASFAAVQLGDRLGPLRRPVESVRGTRAMP